MLPKAEDADRVASVAAQTGLPVIALVETVVPLAQVDALRSRATVTLPLVWRHTPAGGAQQYKVRAAVSLFNGSGAWLSETGSVALSAFALAEENKV